MLVIRLSIICLFLALVEYSVSSNNPIYLSRIFKREMEKETRDENIGKAGQVGKVNCFETSQLIIKTIMKLRNQFNYFRNHIGFEVLNLTVLVF